MTAPSHKTKTRIKTLTCRVVSNFVNAVFTCRVVSNFVNAVFTCTVVSNFVNAVFTCTVVLELFAVILGDRTESHNTSAAV